MESFFQHDFQILEIQVVVRVKAGAGLVEHVNRPGHGLVFNDAGQKIYDFSDGTPLSCRENEVFYLPRASSYQVKSPIPGDCIAINFTIRSERIFPPFSVRPKNFHEIRRLFEAANGVWLAKESGYRLKCRSLLYEILYQLQKTDPGEYTSSAERERLKPAMTYLFAHYPDGVIPISKLAQCSGVSEAYFRRLFNRVYGTSPVRYINALRIEHAKELIDSGFYDLAGVSELCGFSDPGYFVMAFKKSVGMTPSVYRKKAQKG